MKGLDQSVQQITNLINSPMAAHFFKDLPQLTEMDIFVLSSAVTGVIRSALIRDISMLSQKELEDKIIVLIRSYIRQNLLEHAQ